ncbi:hypothetical protein Tco_1169610, partial [Tanacetum coccineum]
MGVTTTSPTPPWCGCGGHTGWPSPKGVVLGGWPHCAAAAGKAAAVVVVPAVVVWERIGASMVVGHAAVGRSDEDGGEDGVKILAGKDGGSPEKSAGKVFPAARRLEREGRG